MVETSEQIRPFAPASERTPSSDHEAAAAVNGNRRRRWLWCCSCVAAVLLIQAIVVVILIFTMFKAKDPVVRLNSLMVKRLELINGTTTPRPGSNMSLIADVSVKNPSYASFHHQNLTTALFYRSVAIGESHGPAGWSRARHTVRMNFTVELILDRILAQPDFRSDMNSGLITAGSYTEVGGRLKILMMKKHVRLRMNCTVVFNITSQAIQELKCKRKVKL